MNNIYVRFIITCAGAILIGQSIRMLVLTDSPWYILLAAAGGVVMTAFWKKRV